MSADIFVGRKHTLRVSGNCSVEKSLKCKKKKGTFDFYGIWGKFEKHICLKSIVRIVYTVDDSIASSFISIIDRKIVGGY